MSACVLKCERIHSTSAKTTKATVASLRGSNLADVLAHERREQDREHAHRRQRHAGLVAV